MRNLILACSLAFIAPLHAAEPVKNVKDAEWHKQLNDQFGKGKRRALLIAIDEYLPPQNPLKCCVNDANLLGEVLHKYCGYEVANIKVLANKEATTVNIAKSLVQIMNDSKPEDSVFISYGGHGGLLEGRSFMCTYDMDSKNIKGTAVFMDDVRELLKVKKIAQKILYLDTCHSGSAKNAKEREPATEELMGPFSKASGLITLAGCRRNQFCNDYKEYGVFTGQFARGLAGEADFDKNGIVDSDEIYRHVIMEVPPTVKLIDPKLDQIPVRIIGEDVVGVFALSKADGKDAKLLGKLPHRPKVGDVIENSAGMKLIYLPSGVVPVGSPDKEYLRNDDERQQAIFINAPIYMGIYEVTQDEYQKVMGKNPSYFSVKGDGADSVMGKQTGSFPVEQVSWKDAVEFCEKLSKMPDEVRARRSYRLPTEGEWEFACRAGTQTVFSTGDRLSSKQANIKGDKTYLDSEEGPTLGRTAAVGSYKPNAFGLYDMHGNVAEWCQDFYTAFRFPLLVNDESVKAVLRALYDINNGKSEEERELGKITALEFSSPSNPQGPPTGESRVYRGGSFTGDVTFARSAARREKADDYTYRAIGFRVVCYTPKLGN